MLQGHSWLLWSHILKKTHPGACVRPSLPASCHPLNTTPNPGLKPSVPETLLSPPRLVYAFNSLLDYPLQLK